MRVLKQEALGCMAKRMIKKARARQNDGINRVGALRLSHKDGSERTACGTLEKRLQAPGAS